MTRRAPTAEERHRYHALRQLAGEAMRIAKESGVTDRRGISLVVYQLASALPAVRSLGATPAEIGQVISLVSNTLTAGQQRKPQRW